MKQFKVWENLTTKKKISSSETAIVLGLEVTELFGANTRIDGEGYIRMYNQETGDDLYLRKATKEEIELFDALTTAHIHFMRL
ncbi:hypothetical protein LD13_gp065 [Bacillus phage Bobb]|uniref:Uncharacterized protein n=1 Tax=Bacillus phage Bobb TaxID=1527469 RepID=A0A076G781_9CAUD|nr:hypothetical protein LD13_gp065 [Bacillus phage Bobb]AII27966.1 hypothetical protein [Bacillus phage Bobb]